VTLSLRDRCEALSVLSGSDAPAAWATAWRRAADCRCDFRIGAPRRAILHPPAGTDPFATAARERGAFSWSRYRFAEFNPQATYPAEVLRVIDGDTFEARVRIWSGFEINTRVRLRAIDAPELHARCASEYLKAEAARAALQRILSAGGVTVSQVGPDKYRGRIDAAVATRDTPDVAAALLKGGFARSYDGGRRESWC
jgi:endonuclease YncB( thermonuclease family)